MNKKQIKEGYTDVFRGRKKDTAIILKNKINNKDSFLKSVYQN